MFSVLFKLNWFFRQHWQRYAAAITVLIISGLIETIPPKLIGYSVDETVLGRMTWSKLAVLLGGFACLIVITYLMTMFWMYRLFGGAFLVERALRSRLMNHFLRMTPTFYAKNRTGDLMARATNDLRAVSTTAGFGILTLLDSSEWLLLLFFIMGFTISWQLTLAALIPLPLIAVAMGIYGRKIHSRFMAAQDAFGAMNDDVLETISGVRVIRAFAQESENEKRFGRITEDVFQKNMSVTRIDALFDPTIKILVGASYLIGIGYGALLVYRQAITLGDLVSFNIYLGMIIWPMFAMGELINIMQRGNASLDRVEETLAHRPDVQESEEVRALDSPGDISFERVTFQYPTASVPSLRDVSFVLRRGQTLGIVGRTGSGKTTIIRQLLREYPSGAGKVAISGAPIQSLALQQLLSWMGYVPQDAFLFSKTVKENILFGTQSERGVPLADALEAASLRQDIGSFSAGLETIVGERGVSLSGGQKQRVSIARALIGDPEILLLDDALSAVDAKTERAIINAVRSGRQGKTTIIAAHRLSAVMHADLILVLEDGKVVERGTHQELLEQAGWYREQFELQQLEDQLEESR